MCTLIVSIRQHDAVPLVVAANRDELLTRPARGPFKWKGLPFVAPRDEQAGGSWLGLTTRGLFVGVTNRFMAPKHDDRESRGTLVIEALQASSAKALAAQLASLSARRFNAFHLLYADDTDAFVTWSDGDAVHHEVLAPGLHVVTERSYNPAVDTARVTLIRDRWPTVSPPGGVPTPLALQQLLALRHPSDPFGSVRVEAPAYNYGTRSSLVLLRARPLADSRFFWADGPPDTTPFVEHPELISALGEPG